MFDALPVSFKFTDKEWASHNLTMVRLATVLCRMNSAEVNESLEKLLGNEDCIFEALDEFARVRGHLDGLAKMIRAAEARVLVTLEAMVSAAPAEAGS